MISAEWGFVGCTLHTWTPTKMSLENPWNNSFYNILTENVRREWIIDEKKINQICLKPNSSRKIKTKFNIPEFCFRIFSTVNTTFNLLRPFEFPLMFFFFFEEKSIRRMVKNNGKWYPLINVWNWKFRWTVTEYTSVVV